MKRIKWILLITCILLMVASCTRNNVRTDEQTESLSQPYNTETAVANYTENPSQMRKTTQQMTVPSEETQSPSQEETTRSISESDQVSVPSTFITAESEDVTKPPFEGKIALITNSRIASEVEYESGVAVSKKYGRDRVVHVTWPASYFYDQQGMIDVVTALGSDPDIKAIIINQTLPGTNAAIDKLKETRNDIFVAYIIPQDDFADSVKNANLLLDLDLRGIGPSAVRQAKTLGARTFVYYSIQPIAGGSPMNNNIDLIEQECAKVGIEFIETPIPHPYDELGLNGSIEAMRKDVDSKIVEYGKDTAFFVMREFLDQALLEIVMEAGAINPHLARLGDFYVGSLALALDLTIGEKYDIEEVIAQERVLLAEKNMLGRISSWPVKYPVALTVASADYAVKWINGEVPREGIDREILTQLMSDYVGVQTYLTPFVIGYSKNDIYNLDEEETGEVYENFLLMRMDYITFD